MAITSNSEEGLLLNIVQNIWNFNLDYKICKIVSLLQERLFGNFSLVSTPTVQVTSTAHCNEGVALCGCQVEGPVQASSENVHGVFHRCSTVFRGFELCGIPSVHWIYLSEDQQNLYFDRRWHVKSGWPSLVIARRGYYSPKFKIF